MGRLDRYTRRAVKAFVEELTDNDTSPPPPVRAVGTTRYLNQLEYWTGEVWLPVPYNPVVVGPPVSMARFPLSFPVRLSGGETGRTDAGAAPAIANGQSFPLTFPLTF